MAENASKKRDILVVDDEPSVALSYKLILEENGYDVRTAITGVRAIEVVRARRPDLVLLDAMMPGRDGYEVCRELRRMDKTLMIVFLTALDSKDDELKALAAGGNSLVSKLEPEEILLARIAALLQLTRTRSEAEDVADFDFGAWHVNAANLMMTSPLRGPAILTEREILFLRLLAQSPNQVFDRDWLARHLWVGDDDFTDNALTVFVYSLRKKLSYSSHCLVSIRGLGYSYRP